MKSLEMDNLSLHIVTNWGAEYPKPYEYRQHWVNHYREMGVNDITILLHSTEEGGESYKKLETSLNELKIDNIVPWHGVFLDRMRSKLFNKYIIPKIFKSNESKESWVIPVDDDELFEFPCKLSETKSFLKKLPQMFPNKDLFITGRRINRERCDGVKPNSISLDNSLYEQFPCKKPQEEFLYKSRKGKLVKNNITKVLAINSMVTNQSARMLIPGQHSVRCVSMHHRSWDWKMKNSELVDNLRICKHDDNIIEILIDDGAYEYKHFNFNSWWSTADFGGN